MAFDFFPTEAFFLDVVFADAFFCAGFFFAAIFFLAGFFFDTAFFRGAFFFVSFFFDAAGPDLVLLDFFFVALAITDCDSLESVIFSRHVA